MRAGCALILLAAGIALAQDRPNEETLFGGAPDAGTAAVAPTPGAATPPPAPRSSTQEPANPPGLAPVTSNAFESGTVREDPLKIGGQFYWRGLFQATQSTPPSQDRLSVPTLLDVYMDVRPSDRVRAMVLGRLAYDPFLATSFPGLPPPPNPPPNPQVALDQAWLTFDIDRKVFVTAGRQHVHWGTAHFFSPDDFLSSARLDPLAQFDTRLGVTMVRAVVPWEATGWNFTAVSLFEPTQQVGGLGIGGSSGSTGVTSTLAQNTPSSLGNPLLGSVGGAARAEATFGDTVIGIDGLVQRGRKPRLGADISTPLGPLDVYAEALLIKGADVPLYEKIPNLPACTNPLLSYQTYTPDHLTPSATVGGSYSFAFLENKSVTLGAEYFYNGTGYSKASIYPYLILNGVYQPFYTGVHYLAANVNLSDPAEKTSYTLSNIGNLSDQSYVARFDFVWTTLSYLQIETFADYHYGNVGGEFRFAVDTLSATPGCPPPASTPGIPAVHTQPAMFDVGFGLRLAI